MRKITIQQWSLGSHMTNPYMVHLLFSRVARWTFACGRFEVLSTVIAGGISALCEKLEVISVPVRASCSDSATSFFLWMQVMNSSCNKLHVKSASIGGRHGERKRSAGKWVWPWCNEETAVGIGQKLGYRPFFSNGWSFWAVPICVSVSVHDPIWYLGKAFGPWG